MAWNQKCLSLQFYDINKLERKLYFTGLVILAIPYRNSIYFSYVQ